MQHELSGMLRQSGEGGEVGDLDNGNIGARGQRVDVGDQ
jgi:hypothetical protein